MQVCWEAGIKSVPRIARRAFLARCGVGSAGLLLAAEVGAARTGPLAAGAGKELVDGEGRAFLRELAGATIESARVRPGQMRGGMGPNATGVTLVSPGGNYPALWVRDFAMSLDCGLIGAAEVLAQLRLIARCQNGREERRLASGAIVPPFAVVDHVNLGGGAVFYPGTYSAEEDQGAAPWGPLPPIDDHYYFVHIAHALWRDTGDAGFLDERIGEWTLFERIERAFASPAVDPKTGVVVTSRGRRAVGFGFQDSVQLVGALAFATLLRQQAASQLAALCAARGKTAVAAEYRRLARRIAGQIVPVFGDRAGREGWLRAATEVGRQPDVWATLFALHLGLLPRAAAARARAAVVAAVRAPGHSIEYQGAVRHVPADRYYRPDRCWEAGGGAAGTYQSGAFWHTPAGWLVEAIAGVDPGLAREVVGRYLRHLREGDFRRGSGRGAPWECFGLELAGAQNPVYMTSVTVPLAVFLRRG